MLILRGLTQPIEKPTITQSDPHLNTHKSQLNPEPSLPNLTVLEEKEIEKRSILSP